MADATFGCPDLTRFCRLDGLGLEVTGHFCRLDGLGLEVTGQLPEPERAVLACRPVDVEYLKV